MNKSNKINKKNFLQYFTDNNVNLEDPMLLSLSGGVDSITLFHLLKKYLKIHSNLHIIIFDHQVRHESSFEIKKLIKFYDIDNLFKLKVFKLGNKLGKNNFQKQARDLRIKKIIFYAKKNNIKNVFFGHHNDDLIETFFLRKIQISGINGLTNIFSNYFDGIKFNRPLVRFSKFEIIKFAKINNLKWFEDNTNIQNIYTRNKIRNYIIENDCKANIKKYMLSINSIDSLDTALLSMIKMKKNNIEINKKIFNILPAILQKYFISIILKKLNYYNAFRQENINSIMKIMTDSSNSIKKRSITGGFICISEFYFTFMSNKGFKQNNL